MKRLLLGLGLVIIALLPCSIVSAQWVQTNGPCGGYVSAIAAIEGKLFAGTGDGVFVSTNAGNTWTRTPGSPRNNAVLSLIANGSTLYAGTSEAGILRSTDEGVTWSVMNKDLTSSSYLPMAVLGTTLFVGGVGVVHRTTDDGASWSSSTVRSDLVTPLTSLLVKGTDLYAGAFWGGLYRSSDGGETWTYTTFGGVAVRAMAASATSVFVAGLQGVQRSTDDGATWLPCSDLGVLYIGALGSHGDTVYASRDSIGVFRSTDDGVSWSVLLSDLPYEGIASFAFAVGNTFATSASGIRRSSSGFWWTEVNDGLLNTSVSALSSSGSQLFAGTYGSGVFRSSDQGITWIAADTGMTSGDVASLVFSAGRLFASTGRGVFSSSDDGSTWVPDGDGLNDDNGNVFIVHSLVSTDIAMYAATSSRGVYARPLGQTVWQPVSPVGFDSLPVIALVANGQNVFAASHTVVAYSSTAGATWSTSSTGLPNGNVVCLAIMGNRVFAGTTSGAYVSTNNASSWTASNIGIDTTIVRALVVHGTNLFASTISDGVFVSADSGRSWRSFDSGLDKRTVSAFEAIGTELFAGTRAGGLWRRPLDEVVSSVDDGSNEPGGTAEAEPMSLRVSPNPVDAAATIEFSLSKSGFTTLNIFSIHGECIATLVSDHLAVGPHSIQWNSMGSTAGAAVGGFYLVRLQSGGNMSTVPLVIVH